MDAVVALRELYLLWEPGGFMWVEVSSREKEESSGSTWKTGP
jgi:hypothetical protein